MSNPGILQLFWTGEDQSVHSIWRNPDGSWSGEQNLGGVLISNPIAAQVPGTGILQLFYVGTDYGVWSRWRTPNGSWSPEQNLGGNAAFYDLAAAQVPGTVVLQLFYVGPDNGLRSRWRNPDGGWSDEQNLGGLLSGHPIAAQVPGTDVLQVFYVGAESLGSNIGVRSRWRNPDGSWSDEQSLGGNIILFDLAAAQVPGTDVLQLFYVGTSGGVQSRWRNPDGSWSDEQFLGGVSAFGIPCAAQVPGTDVRSAATTWRLFGGTQTEAGPMSRTLGATPTAPQLRRKCRARMSSRSFTWAGTTACGRVGGTQTEAGPMSRTSGVPCPPGTTRSLWP